MSYQKVVVLIPSHSLEDFPTELGDKHAESLLNAFSVAFHPKLIASTGLVPGWHRADEPTTDVDGSLVIVPTACDDQLPAGWVNLAREQGAVVVSGLHDRCEMVSAALAGQIDRPEGPQTTGSADSLEASQDCVVEDDAVSLTDKDSATQHADSADVDIAVAEVSEETAADFHALGTCWILLELLTRHMHHFNSYDEVFFEKTLVAAAKDAVKGDAEGVDVSLRASYELLLEARERFFSCRLLPSRFLSAGP